MKYEKNIHLGIMMDNKIKRSIGILSKIRYDVNLNIFTSESDPRRNEVT